MSPPQPAPWLPTCLPPQQVGALGLPNVCCFAICLTLSDRHTLALPWDAFHGHAHVLPTLDSLVDIIVLLTVQRRQQRVGKRRLAPRAGGGGGASAPLPSPQQPAWR